MILLVLLSEVRNAELVTRADKFQWHAAAGVFVAEAAADRPVAARGDDFRVVPALPEKAAVAGLGAAVRAGLSFCITPPTVQGRFCAAPPDFLTFTGGTSGAPKVIRRSQSSWIASFDQNRALFDLRTTDRLAVLGGLSYSLSLYAVLEAMHLGMDAHLLGTLRPRSQRQIMARRGVSILYATPAQLHALTAGAGTAFLPDLRLILCGGGRLEAALQDRCRALCPNADIRQFYGAAETSFVTLADAATPPGSVGRAYPNVDLQVDQGEVWVKSPYLFEGYAAGSSPDTRWRDGYLSVGEMGRLDGDGNLWLEGRRSRMVTIADQNVFPEAIEQAIAREFDGLSCTVLAVPDRARGQRLAAIVEGPEDPVLSHRIRQFCRARFGNLIAPHRVRFHADMPQLPSGKPDLRTLAAWLEAQS